MSDFAAVFRELRAIMLPYAVKLAVKRDDDSQIYIDTHFILKNKKPLFFGAVQVKKAYVSFHLMPLYVTPALVEGVGPALRARMQGKSCFNFKKVDKASFEELAALTKLGYASYRQQGFVP